MMEEGTAHELKENILKHLLWKPGPKAVVDAQQSFVAEADKNTVVIAELVEFETRGTRRPINMTYPVIQVIFTSKRERNAVVTKSVRAARRARLALYRLEGVLGSDRYTAFLRADA
jgi:hypothetical protein